MGNVNFGVDKIKVLQLKAAYNLRYLVETGTWKGANVLWYAGQFKNVITIEADRQRYDKTRASFEDRAPLNVTFWFGDSRIELTKALQSLDDPCLIFLDAHWLGGAENAHRVGDECPLLPELAAINDSFFASQHVVMIDDARLFTAPPPYPHDSAQWPTYDEIVRLLAPRRVSIENDVIYAEPPP